MLKHIKKSRAEIKSIVNQAAPSNHSGAEQINSIETIESTTSEVYRWCDRDTVKSNSGV